MARLKIGTLTSLLAGPMLDAATQLVARLPDTPHTLHTVAAAAMNVEGSIYTGVNVDHFTGGLCAEVVCPCCCCDRRVWADRGNGCGRERGSRSALAVWAVSAGSC